MATLDKEIKILMLKGERGTKGQDGQDGTNIDRIEKTATSGLVDTYTVYLSDGRTTTFQVTNGKDGQDGEVTQAQLDVVDGKTQTNANNITLLQQFLNKHYFDPEGDYTSDVSIQNTALGFEMIIDRDDNDYSDDGTITFNSGGIFIYNIYEDYDEVETTETRLGLFGGRIVVYQDNTTNSLDLTYEKIEKLDGMASHLYRHDIRITHINGGARTLYFSLYLSQSTSITTMEELFSYIGTSNDFNANGTWVASNNTVGLVNYAWTDTTINEINVGFYYIDNGVFNHSNGTYNSTNAIINDKVTQVY